MLHLFVYGYGKNLKNLKVVISFFPDFNKRIKVQTNHAVVFPSVIQHSVDEIQMLPEHIGKGFGRYSICNFLNYKNKFEV